MKWFVLSDIHGSLYYLEKALERFHEEQCDRIMVLGDCLYHGPRNPLPKDYNPKRVAERLNAYKDRIVAVRGNCDSEVDQMVLDFEIMGDYHILVFSSRKVFFTHGHLYHRDHMPQLSAGDLFVHGHYHVPMTETVDDIYYLNPGSVSLPKNGTAHSYALLDNEEFVVKGLDGTVVQRIAFD